MAQSKQAKKLGIAAGLVKLPALKVRGRLTYFCGGVGCIDSSS